MESQERFRRLGKEAVLEIIGFAKLRKQIVGPR
jgi:hypothetical protein